MASAGDSVVPCRWVLGTVPVEDDGSVYCEAPVGKAVYFQLLDEKGMAVHSMRSATYVHPGEHLSQHEWLGITRQGQADRESAVRAQRQGTLNAGGRVRANVNPLRHPGPTPVRPPDPAD